MSREVDDRVDEFVRLLAQHQRRLYLYVVSLVPRPGDAEEVLQETNLVLWREFGQFRPGTNFAAWACRVAFHQVLAWRKKRQRDRLEFSDEFLAAVAAEAEATDELLECRCRALATCLTRLPPHHRTLIQLRYSEGHGIDTIAEQLGRTVDAVYRALSRIRRELHECVTRSLAQEA
ncbi:MAG: sigma-70 family RNA polymerase sigma factor [Gemmataceae bacterium]